MKKLNYYLILFILGFPGKLLAQNYRTEVNSYMSASSQVSTVSITANIKSSLIEARVKDLIHNPLVSGESEEMGVMLHGDQAITTEQLTKVLVTPAREAYNEIQRIPHTISKTIKVGTESYKYWLNPFKWIRKFKDIFKLVTETIYEEVTVRIPAVEAIYKDVMVPVITIQQAIIPIRGKFSYSVSNKDLDIRFDGNKYTITAIFEAQVTTHLSLANLPKEITPKGSVSAPMQIKIVQSGYFNLNPDGTVKVTDPNTQISVVKVLGSDFMVDAIEAGTATAVNPFLSNLIGKQIDKALNSAVKKALDKNLSGINIKDKTVAIIDAFNKPLAIKDYGFMYPNVTKVFVTQPVGTTINGQNQVSVKLGIAFQPFATVQKENIVIDRAALITFGTELKDNDSIHVSLPVFLDYPFIAQQLDPYIQEFNNKNKNQFLISNYIVGKITPVFDGDNNLNLSADILKRTNNKKMGTISFSCDFTVNQTDSTICANVARIKIKANSLLVFFAKPFLKSQLSKQAEKNKCKSLAKEIRQSIADINKNMEFKTPVGTIKGTAKKLTLTDVSAFPNYLLIKMDMNGTIKMQ